MVSCRALNDEVRNEDFISSIHTEIDTVNATSSLHFVKPDQYEWVSACDWRLLPVRFSTCRDYFVNSLGISIRRMSGTQGTVKWGGDQECNEPCIPLSEYPVFSSVSKIMSFSRPQRPDWIETSVECAVKSTLCTRCAGIV